MTRAELLAWLEARRPVPPDALRARLQAAVSDAEAPLPDHLARLGRDLLAAVAARAAGAAGDRDLALDLLAADAFITYSFEAQTEADVAGVAGLAQRVGEGALR
ncbi:MAG TPA: hypothetical protein VFD76_05900 [Gemmatimonadales bacterium]|jgi:hypothetical protein|nr:hypothetical protein [Gemmatimonadales bacterium]